VELLTSIRAAQRKLWILSNRETDAAGFPDQPEYLAGFATGWWLNRISLPENC